MGVCLHGGIGFESCPMHVINILIFSFIYFTYLNRIYYFLHFSRSVRFTLRQRQDRPYTMTSKKKFTCMTGGIHQEREGEPGVPTEEELEQTEASSPAMVPEV